MRPMRLLILMGVATAALLISGCGGDVPDPEVANPASEFCVSQGGEVDIVEEDGGEIGYCVLPDGTRIEEWEFYRSSVTTEP